MPTAERARRRRWIVIDFFCALSLSACVTSPKHEKTVEGAIGSASGQWHGKALVSRTLKSGKRESSTIDLQIVGKEPHSLRVDAIGPFGIHLMSLTSNGNRLQILLPREKKFIVREGLRAGQEMRAPTLPGKVTPEELLAILFDRPLDRSPEGSSSWECSNGGGEIVFSCFDRSRNARVIRDKSSGDERRFEFSDPNSNAELVLYEAKAKVEMNEKTFELQEPSGYKIERLK